MGNSHQKTIVFFQPYLAGWRHAFLERFAEESETYYRVIAIDGNFYSRRLPKARSVKNNPTYYERVCLKSIPAVFEFRGQKYPLYFSPGLLFSLMKLRPSAVVTEGEINFVNNISIWLYCRMLRVPYIWWSLGKVRGRKATFANYLFDGVIDRLRSDAALIVARNSLAMRYFQCQKKIDPSRVVLAPNSMDERLVWQAIANRPEPTIPGVPSDCKVVLFVGSLEKTKKLDNLVNAFRRVRATGSNVVLVIVGDGEEEQHIKSLAGDDLERSIFIHESLFGDRITPCFLRADVVVLPGLGGLAIHHAMLHGKPVIAGVADGTELDLIDDGKNGFLLNGDDIGELAEKISIILNDDELAREMGQRALQVTRNRWNMGLMIDGFNLALERVGCR